MELEHKLVDGPDLAREELQRRGDLHRRSDGALPEAGELAYTLVCEQHDQLVDALRAILDGAAFDAATAKLPERLSSSLEAIHVAVAGEDHLGDFVYASDRRDMLEQALAVLQPELSASHDGVVDTLRAELAALPERVAKLRHELSQLEDSEDELLTDHVRQAIAPAGAPADTAKPPGAPAAKPGKPDPAARAGKAGKPDQTAKLDRAARPPAPSDPEAPPPASTLTGPELPESAPPSTTLTGPDLPAPAPLASTLTGPDAPEPAPPPTTLIGPDLPESAPDATTLTGPEPPESAPAPTTLTDPGAGEAATGASDDAEQKKSWWRRPFG